MIELFSPTPFVGPNVDGYQPGNLTGNEVAVFSILSEVIAKGTTPGYGTPLEYARVNATGTSMFGFGGDFYDRLHVSQSLIELGNVIGLQQRELLIWNAFLRVQPLAAITATNAEGVTLTGPAAPRSFPVFSEETYQITVSTEGPPTIDATFTFDFVPYDLVVKVTGSRITAWTFSPDWSNPIVERLEWRTDVLQSYDGSEQRRALRLAPRKTLEFEAFFTGKERRYAEALIWGWGARTWALPVWPDGLDLASQANSGATEILLDTASRDFVAGGLVILLSDAFTFEVAEIDTVAIDRITLLRPLVNTWPAGSRIYPARTARLQDQVRVPRWDWESSGVRVSFDFVQPIDYASNAGPVTYRSLPVLTLKPEWSGGFDVELQRKLAKLDNLTGTVFYDDEADLPLPMQRMRWTWVSRTEQSTFRSLLYALRGRQGAAWVPTWTRDLVPVALIADTAQAIDVEFTGYTLQIENDTGRRDIRIELVDGTIFYRRITGSLQISATVERLQIDAALGINVLPADVAVISFMSLCRLDGDAIELAHWTGEICDSATVFKGFRHDL